MSIRMVGIVGDGSRGCCAVTGSIAGSRRRRARFRFCLDSRCLELGGTVGIGGWALGPPPCRGAVWVPHQYAYRNGVHVFIRGSLR
jgi:hypothetical protein